MNYIFNDESNKKLRKFLRNNSTKAEQVLWQHLKSRRMLGYKFRRQFGVGKYIVDFYCPEIQLAVEVDGDTHFSREAVKYDTCRSRYIKSCGIRIVRFTNAEIYENLDEVLSLISAHLKYHPQTPPKFRRGVLES